MFLKPAVLELPSIIMKLTGANGQRLGRGGPQRENRNYYRRLFPMASIIEALLGPRRRFIQNVLHLSQPTGFEVQLVRVSQSSFEIVPPYFKDWFDDA